MIDRPHQKSIVVRGEDTGGAAAVVVAFVRCASTANVDTTTGGLLTIDSIGPLTAGDKVLLKNQAPSTGNKIWTVKSGAWSAGAQTSVVHVKEGTLNGKLCFLLTAANTYSGECAVYG